MEEQEKIDYNEVMKLGFKETFYDDAVYFKQNGFKYSIVELKLTKKIYLDWSKESKLCTMLRIDNNRDCTILAEKPIRNLKHLKETVNFFLSKKNN